MPGGCSSRHSGERIEVAFRHKVVRSEEFLQPFVNLFRSQWLLQHIPLFQWQDFNVAYLASQCHVGTKGDAFQLYLGAFPFGIHLHRFSAGQRRAEVADAIQVHLASFTQFRPMKCDRASSTAKTSVSVSEQYSCMNLRNAAVSVEPFSRMRGCRVSSSF